MSASYRLHTLTQVKDMAVALVEQSRTQATGAEEKGAQQPQRDKEFAERALKPDADRSEPHQRIPVNSISLLSMLSELSVLLLSSSAPIA